jgi:hypothetical protein
MPLGPKIVLAFLMIGLALGVFWLFARLSTHLGDMLGIVIQIALLIGLYTRQTIAWITARWLSAIGAAIMSVLFVLVVMAGTTKLWILVVVGLQITLAWLFFALLGRPDSRAYFNAPRKA